MAKQDPRAKYRKLPPTIDIDDVIPEVDTTQAEVEQNVLREYNNGAEPYLRAMGWLRPR